MSRRVGTDESGLAEATLAMAGGGIVAYPTETQYGLGTDALNAHALDHLAALKGRTSGPVLTLVGDRTGVDALVSEVPKATDSLMRTVWPGPVTLLLPARAGLPAGLVGEDGLVGMRVSGHPAARRLPGLLGRPIVSTSANRHGEEPRNDPEGILELFPVELDVVVDGGRLPPGPASTVVDACSLPLRVRREGAVSRNSLARRSGLAVEGGRAIPLILVVCTGNTCRSPLGEGVFRQILQQAGLTGDYDVASAGIAAVDWGEAMPEAREAAAGEGIDLSAHRPRQLTPELAREADVLLVMEERHRHRIAVLDPAAAGRTYLVKGLAAEMRGRPVLGRRHISDPIGRPTRYYRKTLSDLRREFTDGLEGVLTRAVEARVRRRPGTASSESERSSR